MKSRRIVVVSVLAMAAATTAFAAGSRQDSEADEAVAYEQVKMTLADAIALAERQTGGKAVEATLEQEHGTVSLRLGVPLRPEDQHRGDTHQSLAGEGRPWSGRRADPDGPRVGVHPAASGVQFAIQRAIAEMDGILDTFTALCLWRRRDPDGQGLSGACAALPPRRRRPGAADWNVSGLPRRALVHRRAGGSCRGTVRADRGGEHPASGGSDRRRRVEIAQASGRKPNRFVCAGGQPI